MLKVIVMIDCNICGQPFDHVSTSTDRDPMAWKCLAEDLEYQAIRNGWCLLRSAHHCNWCANEPKFDYTQAEKEDQEKDTLPF
jgi:hypothetical protein